MAGTNTSALPFTVRYVQGSSDALPTLKRLAQAATQTFNFGTPVSISSGYVQATGTVSGTSVVIAGISAQAGDNLANAGTIPVGGASLTYGSVPNQTSAVNIPMGAPMVDGNTGVWLASDTTIFEGCVDAAHTTAQSDFGSIYGLTKDTTTNNWFVDTTITAAASGACVEVVGFVDPIGYEVGGTVAGAGGRVAFRVTRAYQQMFT